MTNNTIPNVPRELLEEVMLAAQRMPVRGPSIRAKLHALLSAPSPAGVYSADPLACPSCASECFRCASPGGVDADHVEDVRAMVADPSPAGVDGLNRYEAFPYLDDEVAELDICESDDGTFVKYDDARAIIDGLRGENHQRQRELRLRQSQIESSGRIAERAQRFAVQLRTERDQQAQRIGELEAALEFACKSLAQVTSSDGSGHADIAVSVLRMAGRKEADASQIVEAYKAGAKWRIDAALSAGKEKQDEHS